MCYNTPAPGLDPTGRRLAERARAPGGSDRTKYGRARASTRSFYTHHMQQIVKAAVVHDARAIRVQVGCLKQRALARAGARGGIPDPRRGVNTPRARDIRETRASGAR